jgi:hypothetical protein
VISSALLVALALLLTACNRKSGPIVDVDPLPTGQSPVPGHPENTLVETWDYSGVIFSEEAAANLRFLMRSQPTGYWKPSAEDVALAEKAIQQFLMAAQDDPASDIHPLYHAEYILDNLETYRRQYAGIVVDGEKRIFCSAFTDDGHFDRWMQEPVFVFDGGASFWRIEYIVPQDQCTNFDVNGEA